MLELADRAREDVLGLLLVCPLLCAGSRVERRSRVKRDVLLLVEQPEVVHRELGLGRFVEGGDLVEDGNGLLLAALRQEEPGREEKRR